MYNIFGIVINTQDMNFTTFRHQIDILLESSVKAVSWKSVAEEVGVHQNTVLKYVHAQVEPSEPNLELCGRIYKAACRQLEKQISELKATSQRLRMSA